MIPPLRTSLHGACLRDRHGIPSFFAMSPAHAVTPRNPPLRTSLHGACLRDRTCIFAFLACTSFCAVRDGFFALAGLVHLPARWRFFILRFRPTGQLRLFLLHPGDVPFRLWAQINLVDPFGLVSVCVVVVDQVRPNRFGAGRAECPHLSSAAIVGKYAVIRDEFAGTEGLLDDPPVRVDRPELVRCELLLVAILVHDVIVWPGLRRQRLQGSLVIPARTVMRALEELHHAFPLRGDRAVAVAVTPAPAPTLRPLPLARRQAGRHVVDADVLHPLRKMESNRLYSAPPRACRRTNTVYDHNS